jgi:hypothetical protein
MTPRTDPVDNIGGRCWYWGYPDGDGGGVDWGYGCGQEGNYSGDGKALKVAESLYGDG